MSKFNLKFFLALFGSFIALSHIAVAMDSDSDKETKTNIITKPLENSDVEECLHYFNKKRGQSTWNHQQCINKLIQSSSTFLEKALSEGSEEAGLWVVGHVLKYELPISFLTNVFTNKAKNNFYNSLVHFWKDLPTDFLAAVPTSSQRIEKVCEFNHNHMFKYDKHMITKRIAGFAWYDYVFKKNWETNPLFQFLKNTIETDPNSELSINAAFNIYAKALAYTKPDIQAIEWIKSQYLDSSESIVSGRSWPFLEWVAFHLTTDLNEKNAGASHFYPPNTPISYFLPEVYTDGFDNSPWGYNMEDRLLRLGAAAHAYITLIESPHYRFACLVLSPIFSKKEFTSQANKTIEFVKNSMKNQK